MTPQLISLNRHHPIFSKIIRKNEDEVHINNPAKIKVDNKSNPVTPHNRSKTQNEKSVVITTPYDASTLTTPINNENIDLNTASVSQLTQKTITVATAAVIVNNKITTPVTLQIRPKNGKSSIEIAQVHYNILMQWIDRANITSNNLSGQSYRCVRAIPN